MSFKLGVLIALFAYSFLTVSAYPSIYIEDLEKLGVLEPGAYIFPNDENRSVNTQN